MYLAASAERNQGAHEREWRVFGDVDLAAAPAAAIVAPLRYAPELMKLTNGTPVIPLDTLFEWGA